MTTEGLEPTTIRLKAELSSVLKRTRLALFFQFFFLVKSHFTLTT